MVLAWTAAAQAAPTGPVKVDGGTVVGVSEAGGDAFKGIPFAAPPVGALRWRAPQPVVPWSGTKTADTFGKICMQLPQDRPAEGFIAKPENMSEDCLVLNVYRPLIAKKLPVMVWIYGGGLTQGSSSLAVYDGTTFARGGVVLVSMNYRLGRFGYFAHPALTKENADGGRLGNYGLMDQVAALQWVKRNIAAFGGDPDNVTIFGESAGALSVDGLMISPVARGLFHRAIAESGYGRGQFVRLDQPSPTGEPSAEADGVAFAKSVGRDNADVAALRGIPAADVVESATAPRRNIYFIRDGKTITEDMWEAFRKNHEAPVPFMLGSNSMEGPGGDIERPALRALVPQSADAALMAAYGGKDGYLRDLSSDVTFTQQTRALARLHQKNGHPTYLYLFGVVSAEDAAAGKGALHASELRYVFGTLRNTVQPITDPAQEAASKSMNAMWRAFATKGDPSAVGETPWPKYDGHAVMHFTRNGAVHGPDKLEPRLDALSSVIDPKS